MKNAMLVSMLVIGGLAACTDDAPAPALSDEDFAAVVEANGGTVGELPINQSKLRTRQDGLCCWGHCNASLGFWNRLISENCRGWVVDTCHRAGLAFDPNGDAWWGGCPN